MSRKSEYGEIRYYDDEVTSDFCNTKTNKEVVVDENYRYINDGIFYRFFAFLAYYLLAIPIVWLISFVGKGLKVKGRKNLRKINSGYVLYANHTQVTDAFLGPLLAFPRKVYIIANKDAVSIKGIAGVVKMLGAIPVPDTIGGIKNMTEAVSTRLEEYASLIVFPEAHIWNYYTGLRPFPVTSFKFSANNDVPAVPVAVTYRLPKIAKKRIKPRITVHIGEPIYNDDSLTSRQNAERMRDLTHSFIYEKTNSADNVAYYTYIKRDNK